jgi:aminoglycoside 3-N-acetyltransferase
MTQGIGYEEIVEGLIMLGLKKRDTLLVHSSLRAFGNVDGGSDTIIRALLDCIGSEGNLIMPTLSFRSVNEESPFFDVEVTPSECGVVTEKFRTMHGVRRSIHPLSSAAAYGPQADFITAEHSSTPCGATSPYYRVFQLEGSSLFLGTGLKSNTLLHVAEEIVSPPYLRYKTIPDVEVKTISGTVIKRDFVRYNCYQTGIFRSFAKMEPIFKERDAIREAQIGAARCMRISARDNIKIGCETLVHNYKFIMD